MDVGSCGMKRGATKGTTTMRLSKIDGPIIRSGIPTLMIGAPGDPEGCR